VNWILCCPTVAHALSVAILMHAIGYLPRSWDGIKQANPSMNWLKTMDCRDRWFNWR